MMRINVSKMEDIHRYIAALPKGTKLESGVIAKRFNLSSAAVGGRMIASSDHVKKIHSKGIYEVV